MTITTLTQQQHENLPIFYAFCTYVLRKLQYEITSKKCKTTKIMKVAEQKFYLYVHSLKLQNIKKDEKYISN